MASLEPQAITEAANDASIGSYLQDDDGDDDGEDYPSSPLL